MSGGSWRILVVIYYTNLSVNMMSVHLKQSLEYLLRKLPSQEILETE